MPSYTVKSAQATKAVEGQYGAMQVIALTLQEYGQEPVTAEWFTKATTNVPVPGDTLEGDLSETQFGLKFKKAQAPGYAGGQRGRSPEESRRIVRQHSQGRALQYVEFAHLRGTLPEGFKLTDLTGIIDFFFRDGMDGGQS